MMLTAENVGQIYRALLHREPEDGVTDLYLSNGTELEKLICEVANSAEFARRRERAPGGSSPGEKPSKKYGGLHDGDVALMERHLTVEEPEAGFVKSFLGVRMRVSLNDAFASISGVSIRDIPLRQIDYHAGSIEFVGTLKAVEASKGAFVVAELGAGWGSWSISSALAAKRLGRNPIRLYAVEGSPGKVDNIKTHFADNGFDPASHTILNAIIGAKDGYAFFPQINVTGDWGASALFEDTADEKPGYDRVRSVSIPTLLADETVIDLIHFDIQGAEADVIGASADFLTERARYLVVGTHTRSIEGRIVDTLLSRGWVLENESPAIIGRSRDGVECLTGDGTQVWHNPRL